MRLFLSSYRAGDHAADLVDFLDDIEDVGVVSNAKDYYTPQYRAERVADVCTFFKSLGLAAKEIDLRPFFDKGGVEDVLAKHRFIWLAGGNAFLLRRALRYSGADRYLSDKVSAGDLAYGGESAGAIMAAPTLRGSEDTSSPGHEDDPYYVPESYGKDVLWDGLGFLDFVLVPHYQSPEIGESIDGYIKYLKENKIPFKAITDRQALIIDGAKTTILD